MKTVVKEIFDNYDEIHTKNIIIFLNINLNKK